MRHQAVMGVVAVACVAVVSAPMIVAHPGGHHRSQQSQPHNGRLTGVDYSDDASEAMVYAAVYAGSAFGMDAGALVQPSGPPPSDGEQGPYSPFVPINPPSVGPARGSLQKIGAPQQAPPEAPPPADPPQEAHAASSGLIQAIVEPEPPPPEPVVLPPEPTITPDPPPPPVVIETPTPVVDVPPPAPPPPPAPVVQALAAPPPPTAVPEPGVWAMLLLGLGFVGAALRRGRRMAGRPANC